MLLKNRIRIEELEQKHLKTDDFVAIEFIYGDKSTFQYRGSEYSEKEFKKLYPNATILRVKFIN